MGPFGFAQGRPLTGLDTGSTQVDEELAVALRPEQARWGRTKNPEPQLDDSPADIRNDLSMQLRITDDATLSDPALPDLELRFDQGEDLSRALEKRRQDRENRGEGDER